MNETRVLQADYDLLHSAQDYIDRAKSSNYIDPVTKRAPSKEAINRAHAIVFFFGSVVIPHKEMMIKEMKVRGYDPFNPKNIENYDEVKKQPIDRSKLK